MPEFNVPQLLNLARDVLGKRPSGYKRGGHVRRVGNVTITTMEPLSPQAVDGGAVFHPEHFARGGFEDGGVPDPNNIPPAPIGHNMPPEPTPQMVPAKPRFSIMQQAFKPTAEQDEYQFQKLEPNKVNTMSLATIFDKAIQRHLALPRADRILNSRNAVKALEPYLGVRKDGKPIALLGQNAKLLKAAKGTEEQDPIKIPDGRGVETTGLSLYPDYKEGAFKLCPNSASCRDACLGKTAGQYSEAFTEAHKKAGKLSVRDRAMNRTQAMMREPEAFAVRLYDDILAAKMEAERNGNHLGVRLNTLSDLNPIIYKSIIQNHPEVSFYDYTKMKWKPLGSNHHYTYSSTGASQDEVNNPHSNWKVMRHHLDRGNNVAMVFTNKEKVLPEFVHDTETNKKYKVIDGRWHDFRPLDDLEKPEGADGVIVGLSNLKSTGAKDTAHKDSRGFFVKYDPKKMGNTVPIRQQVQQMTGVDNDGKEEK